ncbi:MAG: protein kinase domain-containing protein [Acidobacteriota bacterium]
MRTKILTRMTIQPGTRFGPYEITALLGAGGMGEVYRAHDTRLGREVALKVLPSRFASDPDRMRRFDQEARAAGMLNHPNILSVYDLGATSEAPYVVSELLDGETLAERLARGPVAPRKATDYGIQIARGLAAAHERGIVHRDLKPANLFLTRDGQVKILDFGLAKLTQQESQPDAATVAPTRPPETELGMVLGTAGYMSPEQVRGQRADQRSDLFALGAILYEMLSGQRAFQGASTVETMTAILNQDPAEFSDARQPVSPALDRIVRRCLEKNPEERLQSARDLVFALEDSSSSSSSKLSAAPTAHTPLGKIAAVALFVLGAFALGWFLRPATSGGSDAPKFARVVRLVATPEREFSPAISPDGKWIAYLSEKSGKLDLWVKFVAGGDAVNLTANSNLQLFRRQHVCGLEISPDGSTIAFGAYRADEPESLRSVWTIPAPLGGVPRRMIAGRLGLRWSPDGERVVYLAVGGTTGDTLYVAEADGANERELLKPQGGMHAHWPIWSDDGQWIYFIYTIAANNLEPSEIFRIRAEGGLPEPVVRTSRRALYPVPLQNPSALLYSANPDSEELNLWWQPLGARTPERITTGVGDYGEARVAPDGSLVCTLSEIRQSLIQFRLGANPPETRAITSGYMGDLDPSLSPRGDQLAFSSSRSGHRKLWICKVDGSNQRPLTTGTDLDERPAFSPDGSRIAFVSSRGGQRGIWLISPEGGTASLLAKAAVLDNLSWSPDGREIVFAAPSEINRSGLFIVGVTDGAIRNLQTPGPANAPSWSPRGDIIAYQEAAGGPGRTKFIDRNGRPVDLGLANNVGDSDGWVWSRDGRKGALLPRLSSTLTIVDLRQPVSVQFVKFPFTSMRGLTWSPDGSAIIVGTIQSTSDIVMFQK